MFWSAGSAFMAAGEMGTLVQAAVICADAVDNEANTAVQALTTHVTARRFRRRMRRLPRVCNSNDGIGRVPRRVYPTSHRRVIAESRDGDGTPSPQVPPGVLVSTDPAATRYKLLERGRCTCA